MSAHNVKPNIYNREAAKDRGIAPVIPHKANEHNKPAFFAKALCKARARIEQAHGSRTLNASLSDETTAQNLRSILSFAAGVCLFKFVYTA